MSKTIPSRSKTLPTSKPGFFTKSRGKASSPATKHSLTLKNEQIFLKTKDKAYKETSYRTRKGMSGQRIITAS